MCVPRLFTLIVSLFFFVATPCSRVRCAAGGGTFDGYDAVVAPNRLDTTAMFTTGRFSWTLGPPVVMPRDVPGDHCFSVKDPSIVRYGGRWHLFCTVRGRKRSHWISYQSFRDWRDADRVERHILPLTDDYFCAPQVFFFTPRKKWYLIYQISDPNRQPALQPAFSTTADLARPDSWSKPALLFREPPRNVKMWIDFWVICDGDRAHLFFTSHAGWLWHCQTPLDRFPHGWSPPAVVLRGDFFEASHTYRIRGRRKYLTIVEARDGGRRYDKAFTASRLRGPWLPLAATRDKPFASWRNVRDRGPHWADSISHGELLRAGFNERLDVDPAHLRFLVQGVSDAAKTGKPYGQIPWQLGLLLPR